jgi:hypothetical protein
MVMIDIKCKYDELVDPKKLIPHPKNRNRHPKDQINRLAGLIAYQGIRAPIVVSNLSKCIVKGRGTVLACIKNNIKEVPVVYQDFENYDQEYAFIQSDNAIQNWADLNMPAINMDIGDLGPDFNIEMLGIKDFVIDMNEKGFNPSKSAMDKSHKKCPHCGGDL